eukprot:Selendium_serpulae@DN11518_c0_g1_i1.p2
MGVDLNLGNSSLISNFSFSFSVDDVHNVGAMMPEYMTELSKSKSYFPDFHPHFVSWTTRLATSLLLRWAPHKLFVANVAHEVTLHECCTGRTPRFGQAHIGFHFDHFH